MIGAALSCLVLLAVVFVPMAFVDRHKIRAWLREVWADDGPG